MTQGDELFVTVGGRDVGLQAILQKVDAEMQTSANNAVRLGQQYARLAQAQGQPALASEVLAGTMQRAGTASTSALLGVEIQQAKLTNSSRNLGGTIAQLGGQMSSLGGTAGSLAGSIGSLAGSMGTLGTVSAVIGIAKVGLDMSVTGGKILATRDSFDALAKSVNTTGDMMLSKLRAAAQGTVTDAQLIESANSGILLTSGKLANDLPRLLEIARASSKATGEGVGFVFDSLVKGIARGSPQIIDNAKITLDAAGAFETYAKSIGKTSDQLTRGEQQQATLNAVLAAGGDIIAKTGGQAETAATQIAKGQVAIENLKNSLSSMVALKVGPFAADLAALANAAQGIGSIGSGLKGFGDVFLRIQPQVQLFQQLTGAVDRAGGAIGRFAGIPIPDNFSPLRDSINQWLNLLGLAPAAEQQATTATQQNTAVTQQSAAAHQFAALTMDAERQASALLTSIHQAATQATQASATASLLDAQAKDTQQAQTALLNFQTKAAADSFLALNPNISQSGLASAVASGQISQAVAQYIAMTLAAAQAKAALANLQAQAGVSPALKSAAVAAGGGDVGRYITRTDLASPSEGAANAARYREIQRQDQERQAAARSLALQQATSAGKTAIYQKEYNDAVRIYGAQSTEALKAQTDLVQAQQQNDKASARAAKAAGTVKLTDQQKLNNSLLADQQSADDRYEDAEAEHTRNLLKIERDYQAKSLEQQRANEVSKRQSQADFYDRLTSSDLNKKKGGAAALAAVDAQYQAAYQKAQELAQAGNAKLAADYLALKQKQAEQELSYQEALAKAAEEKDRAEQQRLQAVHQLRTAANAEEEKQLLAGGDANVKARDEALASEEARYDESADKIGTSADRAAERKIAAAERAGRAIDAEQAKLTALGQAYDKVAPARGTETTGGVPGAQTPAATPTQPTTTTAPAAASDALVAALQGAQDAIVAALRGVEGSTRETTGAVRNLSGKFAA